MAGFVFVDTETTGLDPDVHEIWEVALIDGADFWRWELPVDLGRADPVALAIGGFHERYGGVAHAHDPRQFSTMFADLTRGKSIVGANPAFDMLRLGKLLRANGACPEWHYRPICVESMALGGLAQAGGNGPTWRDGATLSMDAAAFMGEFVRSGVPWRSEDLCRVMGIGVDDAEKHTALGDARWAKAMFEKVMGS